MEKVVAEGTVCPGHVSVGGGGGAVQKLTDNTGGPFQYYENSTIVLGMGLKR